MGYLGEKASKFAHQYVIESPLVKNFLSRCDRTSEKTPEKIDQKNFVVDIDSIKSEISNELNRVVTVDAGYQEIILDDSYPTNRLCYYSIGILCFSVKDLDNLEEQHTINPNDVGRLKNIDRFHFVLPVQNIKLKQKDFITTIRETIYQSFKDNKLGGETEDSSNSLLNTIKWLIFKSYANGDGSIEIRCPSCGHSSKFKNKTNFYADSKNDFTDCDCGERIYITDCFQMYDLIDEINGSGPIISYVMSAFEVVLIFTLIRYALENNSKWLSETLFIKDGSLALFSKLDDFSYKVIRPFLQFMYEKSKNEKTSYINLIGLEKSGMFMEHLRNTEATINENTILTPSIDYIKKFITGDNKTNFGERTYFGIKSFVKKNKDLAFVLDISIPFGTNAQYGKYIENPNINDCLNIQNILQLLFKLKCNMYDKSFIPIAILNKLVSLSSVPGKKILTMFTKDELL